MSNFILLFLKNEVKIMLRIKQLRQERGLSQRALAVKINCSQKAVDLWESEITEPKASVIIALANEFECTADYILGREDETGAVNVMRDLNERERELLGLCANLTARELDEAKNFIYFLLSKRNKI